MSSPKFSLKTYYKRLVDFALTIESNRLFLVLFSSGFGHRAHHSPVLYCIIIDEGQKSSLCVTSLREFQMPEKRQLRFKSIVDIIW